MAKKKPTRRKPTDATMRNVRAANAKIRKLEREIALLKRTLSARVR